MSAQRTSLIFRPDARIVGISTFGFFMSLVFPSWSSSNSFLMSPLNFFRLVFECHEWSADILIAVGNSNRPIEKKHAFGRTVEPVYADS